MDSSDGISSILNYDTTKKERCDLTPVEEAYNGALFEPRSDAMDDEHSLL